jgi:hypothetical protein
MIKKITVVTIAAMLSLTCLPLQSFALANPTKEQSNALPLKNNTIEIRGLMLRLNEIKVMDKTNLTSKQKRELRREVKTISKTMKTTGNGVYISTGAIIIVIILLIILL